jgi:hypothetical protein
MAGALCPHCSTALPEEATFCGACGRRIEGWKGVTPKVPEAVTPVPIPSSDEATRQIDPTPSLLRAITGSAAAAPTTSGSVDSRGADSGAMTRLKMTPVRGGTTEARAETESAMLRAVRVRRTPVWVASVFLGVCAAAAAFVVARRSRPAVPPAVSMAAPAELALPAVQPTPVPPKAAAAASLAAASRSPEAARRAPQRIEPLTVGSRARVASGGLPHKTVATDSRAVNPESAAPPSQPVSVAAHAAEPAPAASPRSSAARGPIEELPTSATPLTETELKERAEASIDADGVRFVVKAHLPQVHACYGRAFKDTSPGGRVEVAFVISRSGHAERVKTETNTTASEPLARCLEARIAEWQFPRPVGGEFELVYPFVFSPGS